MAQTNNREIVLNILTEVLENNQHSHLVINAVLDKYAFLSKNDRSFIKRVSEGTIENLIQIDYVIELFSTIKIKKMKPEIRNILRLSVYQILYMDSVPDHSVCDEAVKLTLATKKYRNLKGFVNGLLRNICREQDSIEYPDLSIKYSIPAWIVRQWNEQYGSEICSKIISALNIKKSITVRPSGDKDISEIITALENDGVIVSKAPYIKDALTISAYDSITGLKAFKNGDIYIQDVSSMLVGLIANPKSGDFCLDMCAAPGGKSLHLAQLLKGSGGVISRDVSEKKLARIRENAIRCKIDNIQCQLADATILYEESENKFDIVLCDLPCSGLGVIGKKSDIKYNMTEKLQDELVDLQRRILLNAKTYVKKGGYLIYSTCTTNKAENIDNVNWFLSKNSDFELFSINDRIPKELSCESTTKGYIQLLPGIHECDGFFIAKLIKK